MAKIESYPLAPSPISGNDKLIGTDTANNNATKNFTVNQLISFIGLNGGFVPYTGATADVNLNNKVLYAANGVFYGIVQVNTINLLGRLLLNSSAGTSGQVLVSQGPSTNPIWANVSTGAQGVQGPIGPQGPPGPVGPAGLNWRSSWVSGTSYIADDAVAYGGASWFCILATSGTITPDLDTTHWALLASQGATGPAGATGAQGPTGATGPAGAGGSQTLQQVLDLNHNLVDGKNYQGTLAGSGNSGLNINAFGAGAAQGNTGDEVNALGYQAALSNTGFYVNAVGSTAATSNSGYHINALGSGAAVSNSGFHVNAFGADAGTLNSYSHVNLFGYNATATSNNMAVFAGENFMTRLGYGGLTADRLYTFPNKSGTFAMLSDIASGGGWTTLGNSGTNPSTNFIGTTDNQDFSIKRNNVQQVLFQNYQVLFSNLINCSRSTFSAITSSITSNRYISLTCDLGVSAVTGMLQYSNGTFQSNLKADNPTAARNWQLPDEDGTLAIAKYKVYTVLLTYNGTTFTQTILQNSFPAGTTFTFTKIIAGFYKIESSGAFTNNKTFVTPNIVFVSASPQKYISYDIASDSLISCKILDVNGNVNESTFANLPVEIRVYL